MQVMEAGKSGDLETLARQTLPSQQINKSFLVPLIDKEIEAWEEQSCPRPKDYDGAGSRILTSASGTWFHWTSHLISGC